MSRIEDDRDAARLAERIAQQKRAEETKKKESQAADSAFARLVGSQKTEKQRGERQATEQQGVAKSAIAKLLEKKEEVTDVAGQSLAEHALHADDAARDAAARARGRVAEKSFGDKAKAAKSSDAAYSEELKFAEDRGDAAVAGQKRVDQADNARGSEGRSSDSKQDRDSADGKKAEKDGKAAMKGGPKGREGAIKTDADKGGQGQGKKDDQGGNSNAQAAAGFRFNPALMAPVPVAQKNETVASDRLRRLATEIAQKIVERVRVGTNAAGNAEFQIDLKGEVLKGLKMKVSAKNGRISAVFQGSDKDVLKMLSEQSEALKVALTGRGLTLDQFKVEYKA